MRRSLARDVNLHRRLRRTQVSTWMGFSPLELQPDLWLDAADLTTIVESSGAVSQWNDKSKNGFNFTQSVGLNQPTTGTRSQNGLNVLDFDGSNDFMQGGNILEIGSGGLTMLVVGKLDSTANLSAFAGLSRATGLQGGRYSLLWNSFTTAFAALYNDAAGRSVNFDPGAGNRTGTNVWTQRIIRNSQNRLYQNDVIRGTNTSVSGTTSYSTGNIFLIGAYQGSNGGTPPSSVTDGFIGEVLVFLRSLSDAELLVLHQHLISKWGI